MIQNDSRRFTIHLKPMPIEKAIKFKYTLMARDFSKEDFLDIVIKPDIKENRRKIWLREEQERKKDYEEIIDLKIPREKSRK